MQNLICDLKYRLKFTTPWLPLPLTFLLFFQLPFSAVNDDYCDCRDGSDEPGTGACSGQEALRGEGEMREIWAERTVKKRSKGIQPCRRQVDEADADRNM